MSAVETPEVTLPTLEDLGFYVNYWSATVDGLLEVYGITSLVRLQFAMAVGTVMLVAFEQWRLSRRTDKQLRAAGLLPPLEVEKHGTGIPSDDNLMSSGVLRMRARENQLAAQKAVQEQARELLQQMEVGALLEVPESRAFHLDFGILRI
ncbi:unnamed protein product [Cladocopium goreaui]|uniref:Uncharacterized protein n=1 Tax=Cladocopium goreaui TaxID=2562237 RepID=A0A9P1DRC7_9DINO|nr:unnamed protein product [Cladocopium goreaui]